MPFRTLAFAVMLAMLVAGPAVAQQTLRVGSTPTGVPFTFLDTKTNTIQGIMVDLITAVGKDAGFAVQIEPMQFSTLIPALTSNKIDLIAAAMYATPVRAQVVDFSTTVITYGEGKIYDTIPDILRDVNAGRLQAGFADLPIVAYNLQQGGFPGVRLVRSYTSAIAGSVGIAVRKSDPALLAQVNAALEKLRADGTLKAIMSKWGL